MNWHLPRRMAQKHITQSSVLWLNFVWNPGTVNSQNNRFPMLIHDIPSHNDTAGVWCAMSAARIIGLNDVPRPLIHTDTLHSGVIFKHLSVDKKTYAFFFAARHCNSSHHKQLYELCGAFLLTRCGTGDCGLQVCQIWPCSGMKSTITAQQQQQNYYYSSCGTWWHTRRNQNSSFPETDESIQIGGGVSSVDYWQSRSADQ